MKHGTRVSERAGGGGTRMDHLAVLELAEIYRINESWFFMKKLVKTRSHRHALIRNMLSSLVLFGKIETTVAKAKVLKYEADKLINKIKMGNFAGTKKASKMLFMHSETMPQLKLLAARFQDRQGGYTRLILNGYNRPGSDCAPKAIVEFIAGPKDTVLQYAQQHLPKLMNDLATVQKQLYRPLASAGSTAGTPTLTDPVTGETAALQNPLWAGIRDDLRGQEVKLLSIRERTLQRLVGKMERGQNRLPVLRAREEKALESMWEVMEKRHARILGEMQEKLDALAGDAFARETFLEKVTSKEYADTPLMKAELAIKHGVSKRISSGADGKLFWDRDVDHVEPVVEASESSNNNLASVVAEKKEGGILSSAFGRLRI